MPIKDPPKRIYLQWEGQDKRDRTPSLVDMSPEVTWCTDRQFDTDVVYVRLPKKRKKSLRRSQSRTFPVPRKRLLGKRLFGLSAPAEYVDRCYDSLMDAAKKVKK